MVGQVDAYAHVPGAGSSSHDVPRCAERFHIYANRVQYSKQYSLAYGCMILINVGLLVWTIVEADYPLTHPARWVFLLADLFVTAFVLLEIMINMGAIGWRRFWRLWSNWFDVTVALLCVAVIAMHALGPTALLEEDEEVETGILICRYAAQITRLGVMVKNLKRQAQHKELRIDITLGGEYDDQGCLSRGSNSPHSPRVDSDVSFNGDMAPTDLGIGSPPCDMQMLREQMRDEPLSPSAPSDLPLPPGVSYTDSGKLRPLSLKAAAAALAPPPASAVSFAAGLAEAAVGQIARATGHAAGTAQSHAAPDVRPSSPANSTFSAVFTDPKL